MTTAVNPLPIKTIPVAVRDGSGSGVTYPLGYQQLSVTSGAAVSLTVPSGATSALISVATAAVRYRDDGVAPTTSSGFPLASSAILNYGVQLAAIQFIAQSTTATLDILYYK